ncbi:MAG: phosphoadenylyl-sulfate reductase [Actinobacteria bacterium]|nr:phosphoadenylyl-sulfate reductase [Actinomycetota bacterium]
MIDPMHTISFASPGDDISSLDHAHPETILRWATWSSDRLAIATSFQSSGLVLLHLLRNVKPDIPVLFLDTGFHFEETLEFSDRIAKMWDLNVIDLRGKHGSVKQQVKIHGAQLYNRDPELCCFINKVEPLQTALEDYDAWISGIRRDQSPGRSATPVVEAQMLPSGKEIVKIHPLADWSREDVESYISTHQIPTHPLLEKGYRSIGCWPCTRAVGEDEDERAGRWDGFNKTECGIHTFGKPHGPQETEGEQ